MTVKKQSHPSKKAACPKKIRQPGFRCFKRFASLIVLILLASRTAYSDDVVQDGYRIMSQRLTVSVTLSDHGYNEPISAKKGLKLTKDELVLTFEGGPPRHYPLYIMTGLCELDGKTITNDATMLRKGETAHQFWKENQYFRVLHEENIPYARCQKQGFSMELSDRTSSGLIFKSDHRVIYYLNLWSRFLAVHLKDLNRAGDFFNLSIAKQNRLIRTLLDTADDLSELNNEILFFDQTNPLSMLRKKELNMSVVDIEALKQYLDAIIYARRKLSPVYPYQKNLLEEDNRMLARLSGN